MNSVSNAERLFEEYRSYANDRIENYTEQIRTSGYKKDNQVHVLETCLFHPALDSLETRCKEWIKDVDENATVWNPFLIGNIPYIEKGIKDWHDKLYLLSKFKMNDEDRASCFDEDYKYIQDVLNGLNNTSSIYEQWKFPNIWAILTGLFCYALLVFAYIIQERNTRNLRKLFENPTKRRKITANKKTTYKFKKTGPIVGDF